MHLEKQRESIDCKSLLIKIFENSSDTHSFIARGVWESMTPRICLSVTVEFGHCVFVLSTLQCVRNFFDTGVVEASSEGCG